MKKIIRNCHPSSKEFFERNKNSFKKVNTKTYTVVNEGGEETVVVHNWFEIVFKEKNKPSDFKTYKYMDILKNGGKVYHGYICPNGEVV